MDRKEIIRQYKEQKPTGGVYGIKCEANGKIWLKGDTNLPGAENRFKFSSATNSCITPKLAQDWKEYGAKAFFFVILETAEMGENQSLQEFAGDIAALEELWREKFSAEELY